MRIPEELAEIAADFPYPLLFATISGAHLYGFPSPDSDYDLRGCHILPAEHLLGLQAPEETEERLGPDSGLDLDLVSHDVRKFCRLALKKNGYVLEQLLSPLVVVSTAQHEELKSLVPGLLTRHHAHHYLGFARGQWQMFERQPRVKTLLYVHRVLLTGIHLMKTGEVQPHLPTLLESYPQPGLAELVEAKRNGTEKQALPVDEVQRYDERYHTLVAQLEEERERSSLPEVPGGFDEVNEFVLRVRMQCWKN
jgi:hypothetical protein